MTHEGQDPVQLREDAHLECEELLPWLVNGTLAANDRARIEQHLADCAECRAELAQEQDLHRRMSAEDRVAYSPAASFEKLWSRIEELEREVPAAAAGADGASALADDASARAHATPIPLHGRRVPHRGRSYTLSRWLAAAVVVQAIALGWLATQLGTRHAGPPWVYRTVTTPAAYDPALPRFRVVFASQATVADQQDVLARRGLVIVGGPSLAGVFVVAPAEPSALENAAPLLAELRAEKSVRYAELAR
jgi:predicted anti-sigma-YlaC factor YlaD